MNKKVVIFKTHIWNDNIETYVNKIMYDTSLVKIDFFVLVHDEDDKIYNLIKSDFIKKITLKFNENIIKNIYNIGFYSIWLSNHWILMWFFKQNKIYDYYWSIEYDVSIVGNSNIIWTDSSDYDLIYPLNYNNTPFHWTDHYIGGKLSIDQRYHGYLQISRYSKIFLEYLDTCFMSGENGQDELIIFSLAIRGQFKISNVLLKKKIRGQWSWKNQYSYVNTKIRDRLLLLQNDENIVHILHPVK